MIDTGPAPSQMQNTSDGPRKRRKRAPAAGASDDCFTCATRTVKCDRRRPYCTPCLEAGQDCAGYKTQLTWGVGVASRGKLRGLSLPVAGTKKVAESVPHTKKKRSSPTAITPIQFAPSKTTLPLSPESASESSFVIQKPYYTNLINGSANQRPPYHRSRHTTSGSISSSTNPDILLSPVSSHHETPSITRGWSTAGTLPNQYAYSVPAVSPIPYSAPTQSGQYFEHIPHTFQQQYPHSMGAFSTGTSAMTPGFPYDRGNLTNHNNHDSYTPSNSFPISTSTFEHAMTDSQPVPFFEEGVEEISRDDGGYSDTLSVSSGHLIFDMSINWSPFSGATSVGNTPRMQYLIQYYAEVIAPVIVAFDSPTNPFRDQILNLATKSDSLQHALSALAASNLRQRKESGALSTGKTLPARRSSQAHLSLTADTMYQDPLVPVRDHKREEVFHKYHAVQSLNASLADPNLRKNDSVLATLLILCLFHICDSGIARFQTQFEGVKKLLTLRRSELGVEDSNTRWMTRLFTLFDSVAATVNEREGQFESQNFVPEATLDDEWSFETLVGVDGRLFKILSKLGRLNLLGQGKPVESNPTIISRPMPFVDATSFGGPLEFAPFDGNGWMRMADDETFVAARSNHAPHHANGQSLQQKSGDAPEKYQDDDPKSEQFWREWREVRQELQTWNLDTLLYETPGHSGASHLSEEQRLDIENISNAFRYSALLYTERLGNPRIPSGHEKIQYWVRRSLHHIRRVRSDVYLLWPLFITGSECVHEEGRNIIRERCEDIQKDSGFVNNAQCLALLEKVWKAVPVMPLTTASQGQPTNAATCSANVGFSQQLHLQEDNDVNGFRFRNVMSTEGNEGEWIVV